VWQLEEPHTTKRGIHIFRMYVCYEHHILGSNLSALLSQLQACLQYNLLLVGDEEDEEETEEEHVEHSAFTHGTQFEYQDEIYELFSIFIEWITLVPVRDTNEEN
jgi:hypothetical protein